MSQCALRCAVAANDMRFIRCIDTFIGFKACFIMVMINIF